MSVIDRGNVQICSLKYETRNYSKAWGEAMPLKININFTQHCVRVFLDSGLDEEPWLAN